MEEDIFLNDSFAKRLEVKLAQLELYNESLDDLIKDSKSKSLKKELYKVKEILNNSISSNTEAHESFSKKGFVDDFSLYQEDFKFYA